MKFLSIVLFATVASIVYGILHDQITVRICVEYFTIGHPVLIDSIDPTTLALLWGVIATWWMGAGLGVLLAAAARLGKRPKLSVVHLVVPVVWTVLVSGASAVVGGLVGHWLAVNGVLALGEELGELVPEDEHIGFLTNLWAHSGSYIGGFVMGILMVVRTWKRRGRIQQRARKKAAARPRRR